MVIRPVQATRQPGAEIHPFESEFIRSIPSRQKEARKAARIRNGERLAHDMKVLTDTFLAKTSAMRSTLRREVA
jgi:hypothetical protein